MLKLFFLTIAIIVLYKTIFYLWTLFLCYVYFLKESKKVNITIPTNSSALINTKEATKKNSLKATIQRYCTGFIFYGINHTGQIKSHFIRNLVYTKILKINIGKQAIIYGGAEIRTPNKLKIGKGTIIGNYAILDARNGINIGENVNFSHGVWLWTEQHEYNCPDFSTNNPKNKTITIGNRAWLGPRVIVLPGCTIGEGAVIAAGAVVTKDIEPYTLNGGVPCKKIGDRNKNLTYVFTEKPTPFI